MKSDSEREHSETELGEYLDRNREDLEEISKGGYPVSPVVQALLDRHDRGEI